MPSFLPVLSLYSHIKTGYYNISIKSVVIAPSILVISISLFYFFYKNLSAALYKLFTCLASINNLAENNNHFKFTTKFGISNMYVILYAAMPKKQ